MFHAQKQPNSDLANQESKMWTRIKEAVFKEQNSFTEESCEMRLALGTVTVCNWCYQCKFSSYHGDVSKSRSTGL
jgi:hypothetical protein